MEEERISKTIYFCPATNVELNSNTIKKWEKQIKMSLTIPKKIYRRFGVSRFQDWCNCRTGISKSDCRRNFW